MTKVKRIGVVFTTKYFIFIERNDNLRFYYPNLHRIEQTGDLLRRLIEDGEFTCRPFTGGGLGYVAERVK